MGFGLGEVVVVAVRILKGVPSVVESRSTAEKQGMLFVGVCWVHTLQVRLIWRGSCDSICTSAVHNRVGGGVDGWGNHALLGSFFKGVFC